MTMESAKPLHATMTDSAAVLRTRPTPMGDRRGVILDSTSDWETLELQRRARAGVWAARTALVLSVPFAMTAWALGQEHAWFMYMLLPVIAAFFSGVFFGAAICNRRLITDESLAGRQGTLVALMAYVIFSLEVAALSFTPLDAALDAFMYGLVISGWFVFPVSFLAGMLAFRAREGALRYARSTST